MNENELGEGIGPDGDESEPERRRQLLKIGRQLVPQLWGLIRTLGMFDSDNETPHRALALLHSTIEENHVTEEATALIVFGDSAFLNGCRLRLDHAAYRLAYRLSDFLTERHLGGLCFLHGVRSEQIMLFLQELREASAKDDPRAHLAEVLSREATTEITLINPHRHRTGKEVESGGARRTMGNRGALEVYARAMYALKERFGTDQGTVGRRRRQTVGVRRLVVLSESAPETFMQLGAIRALGSPWMSHSLNVTILALALGRQLGLARKHLVRLGLAAMNHNIGETQPIDDADPDVERAQAHPLLGMRQLLEQQDITLRVLQRAVVAAEHHRHFDGINGFPELPPAQPHLFSRIIAVCDAYDTLVWSPVESTRVPPDQALRRVTRGAGTIYDPLLIQVLASLLGRYPPGALVELDGGDLAVVIARGKGEEGQVRPMVLRIRDALGREIEPQPMDLSETIPGKRRYKATIVRARDPVRLDINAATYLFSKEAVEALKPPPEDDPEPSLNSSRG